VALFHGIGLGKEGYSIIGQGKVQQIMNAKPEDRRLIFEEATGLMTFKSRKQEIERKIDDSNNNLYIFRQRIDEAERRLGPLGKQAEAAKEYDEYFSALRTHETNTYIYDHEVAIANKQIFLADLSICQELTLDEWQRRPRWQRPLERLFRRFAHLL
jgi:chromosome segregation ATPase